MRSGVRHPIVGALLLFVVTCILVTPVIALQIDRHTPLSLYDELSYFDSIYKAQHGHYIIGEGEHLSPVADQVMHCRGVGSIKFRDLAACHGTNLRPSELFNTADIDPPTYTFMTAWGARAIMNLGITSDLVTAARSMNVVWAGLGLTVLMLFCRRLGAGWVSSGLVAGLMFFNPLEQTQWVYITPHSLEVTVAAAVAWIVLNWAEGRGRWWAVALAGFVPAWVKATDVLAVAAGIVLLLTVAGLRRSDRSVWRRQLLGAATLIAGLGVGSASFLALRHHYLLISTSGSSSFHVDHFSFPLLSMTFANFLRPAEPGDVPPGLGAIFALLLFGAAGVYMFSRSQPPARRGLGTAIISVATFGAWVFVISNYVLLKQFVLIPGRYGLTLHPLALGCVAALARSRLVQVGLLALLLVLMHLTFFPGVWGIANAVP